MFTASTSSQTPSFAQRTWCVLKAWVRDPARVATVCPSSPILTEHIADRPCVREASRVIELGPGAGGTTQSLLRCMPADAELLAIEKTEAFAESLERIDDPRLRVVIADACDLISLIEQHKFGRADVVVSGIPFSHLPMITAKQITGAIYDVLRPGGTFIAYQFRADVREYARPLFGPCHTETIAMNIPPLRAFVWKKSTEGKFEHQIAST